MLPERASDEPVPVGAQAAPVARRVPDADPQRVALVPANATVGTAPSSDLQGPAGSAAESPATKFGVGARRPGANMPLTSLAPSGDGSEPAPADNGLGDPDAVRSSLSNFQSGTRRADREGETS
jgi:hypothetical protein